MCSLRLKYSLVRSDIDSAPLTSGDIVLAARKEFQDCYWPVWQAIKTTWINYSLEQREKFLTRCCRYTKDGLTRVFPTKECSVS